MARKPATAPASPARSYDLEQLYDVQLLRITEWNGLVFSPGKENHLKGKVCRVIDADIADAQPI